MTQSRVKCGNKRRHGQHAVVYHKSAAEVKDCFAGKQVTPMAGVTVPAGTKRDKRYRRSVDAAWRDHVIENEGFYGEVSVIRLAKEEFYRTRGLPLTEQELENL